MSIFDPRIFNVAIIVLFFVSAIRWAVHGDFWQAGYWALAGGLNICITGMAK